MTKWKTYIKKMKEIEVDNVEQINEHMKKTNEATVSLMNDFLKNLLLFVII